MKFFVLLLLSSFSFSSEIFSQGLFLTYPQKDSKSYSPIKQDRSYAVIINTKLNKDDLIPKTKDFLIIENLADSTQLETTNFDENLSEYRLKLSMKHGQYLAKGVMGAKYVAPPVILNFDAIFSFNNYGQLKITFTNFNSTVIAVADENKFLNKFKGGKGNGKEEAPILKADQAVMDESNTILTTETTIGKSLFLLNGKLDMLDKASRGEYRNSLRKQFEIYKEAINHGSAENISLSNISEYEFGNGKMKKYMESAIAIFKANNLVLAVDNYRWKNHFEPNFNYFFKEISNIIGGSIDKVALDGNLLYENVNGKILPVNPTEKKKWEKNHIEF